MQLHNEVRLNLRRRSTGDYISANCDILLAICDVETTNDNLVPQQGLPPLAQAGADSIVRSHLHGIDFGSLPRGTTLTWADNGPVIRIYCPSREKSALDQVNRPSNSAASRAGDITIWHPKDSVIPEEFEPEWRRRKMEELSTFTRHLEDLNSDLSQAVGVEPGQSAVMLKRYDKFIPETTLDKIHKSVKKLIDRVVHGKGSPKSRAAELLPLPILEPIAILRRQIANLNRRDDNIVKVLTARLFLITYVAIVLLQLFENWTSGTTIGGVPFWRSGAFLSAILLFVFGVVYHWRTRKEGILDRQNDYRAIAEGLRVQFYWSAAGLRLSAADNYLQRAHGELSWICQVVATASLRLRADVQDFGRLSHDEKYVLLRDVCAGWISEQEKYFAGAFHTQSIRKQRLRGAGNILLIAGLVMILTNFTQYALNDNYVAKVVLHSTERHDWAPLKYWAVTAAILWVTYQIMKTLAYRAYYRIKKPDLWSRTAGWLRHVDHPAFIWLGGTWLGWAFFCAAQQTPVGIHWPSAPQMAAIAQNLLLAGGGLIHTWGAFKFVDENTKRYSAMRNLFRSSAAKLDDLFRKYRSMIDSNGAESDLIQSEEAIQAYMAVLGREALQENTDWLQMHRSKVIEPILPIG